MRVLGLLIALPAVFAGCSDDECTSQVSQSRLDAVNQTKLTQDVAAIDAYLDSEGIVAIEDATGMRYVVTQEGSGAKPCLESAITFKYKGMLLTDGSVFDQNTTGLTYPLNQLILGWQIVLPKLKAGSKATLYIPSGYGYGASALTGIPANSNLIFEIELVSA
ncbi:FKBP-type peptidyl-prolyl cis-trans isomerase [Oscillatoria amoena NRMC-F 0135]|nr:FKBP-type peptidyl-prolyl cis-trans isomerase [Oscillatoria amoena NRMC-F 0135]